MELDPKALSTITFLFSFGLLLSLFGYRLSRVLGIILAALWGFEQAKLVSEVFFSPLPPLVHDGMGLLGAIVLALSSGLAFWFMMFMAGCYLGYMLASLAFPDAMYSVLMLSVAMGILCAVLERFVIIGLSAFLGASLLMLSFYFALSPNPFNTLNFTNILTQLASLPNLLQILWLSLLAIVFVFTMYFQWQSLEKPLFSLRN
ncbi:MAG: hypothetical protein R2880_06120 [Deinococcales bacterium]